MKEAKIKMAIVAILFVVCIGILTAVDVAQADENITVRVFDNCGDGYTVVSVCGPCVTVNAMAEDGTIICSVLMIDGEVCVPYIDATIERIDWLADEWVEECTELAFLVAHELWD